MQGLPCRANEINGVRPSPEGLFVWRVPMNKSFCPDKPSVSRQVTPRVEAALPSLPPVRLAGKMTADGYQPENWQWFDILTEPSPSNRIR